MAISSSYRLSKLIDLANSKAASKPKMADAAIVPYGKGSFYLATRRSKVAAFLPSFINRMLKLTLPPQARKSLEAMQDFKTMVSHQFGGSGTIAMDKQEASINAHKPLELSVRHVKEVLGKTNILASQFRSGAWAGDVDKKHADVSSEIHSEIKQELAKYKGAEKLKGGPTDTIDHTVYQNHLEKTLHNHNTKQEWQRVAPYLLTPQNRTLSVHQKGLMNTKVAQMLARAKISDLPATEQLYKAIAEIATKQIKGDRTRQSPMPNRIHQRLLEGAAAVIKSIPKLGET